MPKFSEISKDRLSTCDTRLVAIVAAAIKITDFKVLVGHRNEVEQDSAFNLGKSKLKWPESKHNSLPSKAVDLAPYPIRWDNTLENLGRFYYLAGVIKFAAHIHGVKLRWGGDWDGDGDFSDQRFNDLVHFELVG